MSLTSTEEALLACRDGLFRQKVRALLRSYGGVHPTVLHHAMGRTETEIVHMIGNVEPAMNDARRDDQHVTDFQLDFACANCHAAATTRAVRSAVRVVRAAPAVDDLAVDERRAAAGDDVIAFGLIVVRDGALKCVCRRIGHLLSARGRLSRSLSIASARGLGAATTGAAPGIAAAAGSLSLADRQHVLLRAMNDAQLHAPAIADIDDPGVL